ncbi:MAG: D-glycero-beta-D-manno-heptose-7-phosphate kinase [Rhodospirillales bacterium]
MTETLSAALVEDLASARLLCVGDIMLDRFVGGEVNRISPEAPIPVLRVTRDDAMLGGAGNVVRNLASLGARGHFIGAVGNDAAAGDVARLLESLAGIDHHLVTDADRITGIKTRFIAAGQQVLRADRESLEPLADALAETLIAEAEKSLAQADVVILSDYGKGVLAPAVLTRLLAAARAAGKPVVVDPKGHDYARYQGATVITPNRKELSEAAARPLNSSLDVEEAARSLIAAFGFGAVLATLGAEGMLVVPADGEAVNLPAEAREVFDVSGAGDTVVATLAAALAAGAPLIQAAQLANLAAGIVVGKVGTAAVYASELTAALHHTDVSGVEAKILARDAAALKVRDWRDRGLKVGFTNGCFDILHPGHVSLLNQAKSHCDRLVVGLNSDSSVRRLGKGPNRPINAEGARATVLAALGMVDAVVLFAEDTPLDLIGELRPQVLVKGADYALDQVVGADLVKSWGGEVRLANLLDGHSTTATVARASAP